MSEIAFAFLLDIVLLRCGGAEPILACAASAGWLGLGLEQVVDHGTRRALDLPLGHRPREVERAPAHLQPVRCNPATRAMQPTRVAGRQLVGEGR